MARIAEEQGATNTGMVASGREGAYACTYPVNKQPGCSRPKPDQATHSYRKCALL